MFGFLIAFSWYLDSKVAVLGVMMSQNDLAADLGKSLRGSDPIGGVRDLSERRAGDVTSSALFLS